MKFLTLAGDGIGPEIVGSAVQVLQAAAQQHGIDIELHTELVGFDSLAQ
ncbi:MAG: Isocitrate/isopropylmalate dehydrogenase, partial [Pseudomonadota bacterium]